ncbi:MAG: LLM class flavin-dependent oxidoreductase [Candidatus Rokubacteria bacterium]|nr:LLM class flavin-dependent oxidoreductase [Candidatus Rokubacteria bacterium]
MKDKIPDVSIEVFSTCPPSSAVARGRYLRHVIDVARWSEEAGCRGILVYSDNGLLEPWLLAQIIIQNTASLCPLVAVQPVYTHPYWVAKMVTSLADLHARRVYLNMVAGGFRNDLAALNDTAPHDARYDRLLEYTTVVKALLGTASAVSYEGVFYRVEKLKLVPPLAPELFPGIFVSASSEAGLAAARMLGATAVKYPKPSASETVPPDAGIPYGIRVGIIARPTDEEAWQVAHARFPEDRRGQLTHQLATKTSDSSWHKELAELSAEALPDGYWLGPFQHYQTFCPYLVGSYDRVGEALARYMEAGYTRFILDVPGAPDDLRHTSLGFQKAVEVTR